MTGFAWLLVVLAVGACGADLWALGQGRRDIERYARPAATVAFAVALAAAGGDVPGRWWAVLALLIAAGGDYLLFLNRFIQGVGVFAIAQAGLAVALAQRSPGIIAAIIGLGVVAVFLVEFGRPLLGTARHAGRSIGRSVHLYIGAAATLVAMGFATGSTLAAIGTSTFAASDGIISWRRLIAAEWWMAMAARVLYRLALLTLVLSFAGSSA